MRTSYSLEGEDRLALSLLRGIDKGTYFDIGCADPVEISNTFLFYELGWRGVAVDGRQEIGESWALLRAEDQFCCSLVGERHETTRYFRFPDGTLNTCDADTAARYSARFDPSEVRIEVREIRPARSIWLSLMGNESRPPDLVSIDAEGFEVPIIRGLIAKSFKPSLVIVEAKLFDFLQPSDHPVVKEMYGLGYALVAKTPLDCFFIDGSNPVFSWLPQEMRRGGVPNSP